MGDPPRQITRRREHCQARPRESIGGEGPGEVDLTIGIHGGIAEVIAGTTLTDALARLWASRPATPPAVRGAILDLAYGTLRDYGDWASRCAERKRLMHRKTHYTEVPIKPMRVYEEMNAAFGRDTIYVTTIGLSQIAAAQFLHVYGPRQWINCGQAGPLGWTIPAALGVVAADPTRSVVGISGDYDFQFLIEELAVGAQFRLPYVHVLVNNSYLGLIRQSQRGFDMDYCVQLAFENQNVTDESLKGYGVDHQAVVQGLGCKSLRVTDPEKLGGALADAKALAQQHRVPVVVEVILEKVTNIAMGTEIDKINEFEAIDCRHPEGTQGLELAGLLD